MTIMQMHMITEGVYNMKGIFGLYASKVGAGAAKEFAMKAPTVELGQSLTNTPTLEPQTPAL